MIVSATGHRPNRLGKETRENYNIWVELAIDFLQKNPETTEAVSGMAPGWDIAWAQAALESNVPLVCAIPYDGHEPVVYRPRYDDILLCAAEVVVVTPGEYQAWKYQKRNEWMVDRCDLLVALWDGGEGGTHNCVRYAERVDKPYVNLWDEFCARRK